MGSGVQPEEGELLSVHPGAEGECGVFSEGGDDGGEDQCYQHEAGWEDHLVPGRDHNTGTQTSMCFLLHVSKPALALTNVL